jgi:hypothetical protein
MPDPLHVKLVSESAAGLASASFSPPGATRTPLRERPGMGSTLHA